VSLPAEVSALVEAFVAALHETLGDNLPDVYPSGRWRWETLTRGTVTSTCSWRHTGAWGLQALPEPWRGLIERSREWRTQDVDDTSTAEETLAFVKWAAVEARSASSGSP